MIRTEAGTSRNEKQYNKIVWEGEVVDLLDGEEDGAIKIRIPELDKNTSDSDLPLCYPLFNFSYFRALPRVGERVTVMNRNIYEGNASNNKDIRYWVNVVHSTVQNVDNQSYFLESDANKPDSLTKTPKKIKNIKSANGIYPDKNQISISGRDNCDIVLGDSNIILRVGIHEIGDNLKFNKKNPSFISLRNPNQKSENKNKKTLIPSSSYVPPKHTITVQTSNNSGTITVREKTGNTIVNSTSFTENNRVTLIQNLKSNLLNVQKLFPYWELITFDSEFEGISKVYSTSNTEGSTEVISQEPTNNFSDVLIASDKVFLVSHLNNNFNIKKQPNLFEESDLNFLSENGQPIPYGNNLVELLELFRVVLTNHVHPFDAMKPVQENIVQKLLDYNINSILNPNVLTG